MKKYSVFIDEGGLFGNITIFVGFLKKDEIRSKIPTNGEWYLNYIGELTIEGLCAIKILYEKAYPPSETILHVSKSLPKNFKNTLQKIQDNWGVY